RGSIRRRQPLGPVARRRVTRGSKFGALLGGPRDLGRGVRGGITGTLAVATVTAASQRYRKEERKCDEEAAGGQHGPTIATLHRPRGHSGITAQKGLPHEAASQVTCPIRPHTMQAEVSHLECAVGLTDRRLSAEQRQGHS